MKNNLNKERIKYNKYIKGAKTERGINCKGIENNIKIRKKN